MSAPSVGEFGTILSFLAYMVCLTALCVAVGYTLDRLRNHFEWIKRIAP